VPFSLLLAGGVIGALLSFLIVYLIAKNYGTTMMILSGLAMNMLLGSAIALLLSNAESPWALAELYRWLQGSLMWAKLDTLLISLPIVLAGICCLYHTRRYLDLLTFGEETASTMGVDPKRSFFISTFGVALLVGATIPQTGTIGFIGLIAPHFARILLKARPSQLYLTSALIGALLLLLADLAILYIPLFSHIYIGTLTALIGAPCLIWMLLTQQRKIYD
jgi:iron complex transport system permease protein